MNNPLLEDFDTLYDATPFSRFNNDHFKPAFEKAIEMAKNEIELIAINAEEPSFSNTLEALEFSGEKINRISSIFFNLNSAETNEEIQNIAQEISPLLSEFSNDITLNEVLFKRIKTVYQHKDDLDLSTEEKMLLDKKYKAFVRNGANLSDKEKIELRKIDKVKSKLSLQFGENVLAETNNFEMIINEEKELEGLPEGVIEGARMLAEEKKVDGWIFTLDYPSYIPFMTYADNRQRREKMAKAFGSRGMKNDKYDNQDIVLKIVSLRHKRAKLLGYQSHAHYVLEERMAEKPEKVMSFLNNLLTKAKPAAIKDFNRIQELAKEDGGVFCLLLLRQRRHRIVAGTRWPGPIRWPGEPGAV